MAREMSGVEKIIQAAVEAEAEANGPFTAERLVVTAWKRFPRPFGLKGYADLHPDSNAILASLMGAKGLVRRGWLTRVGPKMYQTTALGRQIAGGEKDSPGPGPRPAADKIALGDDIHDFLSRLFATRAWKLWVGRQTTELNFTDAARFWQLADGMDGAAVDQRLAEVGEGLAAAASYLAGGTASLKDGRAVSAGQIALLTDVHQHLAGKFAPHLRLMRNRKVANDAAR